MVGGTEKYYFELSALLEKKGHQVAHFSMYDQDNVKSEWSKYFVSDIEHRKKGVPEVIRKIPRIFYSSESKIKIKKLLDNFKPDIVHLNNIYYCISPSILSEFKKRNIPVVQTVHDFQLINPNVIMYHNGEVCEIFNGKNYLRTLLHRCADDSYIGTFLMLTIDFVQNFNNFYNKNVDVFVTPSIYMRNKLIERGFLKNKVVHINNLVTINKLNTKNKKNGKYILYFGRLNEAKGIYKIVDLAMMLPQIKIKVAGKFYDKSTKSEILKKIKINKLKNIEFLGFKNQSQIRKLISESVCVIAPSLWHENQSYSILESLSMGVPVVATKMGGNSELIQDKVTGFLFNKDDANEFAKKVLLLWNDRKLAIKMGRSGRKYVEENHNTENFYLKILALYKNLLKRRSI